MAQTWVSQVRVLLQEQHPAALLGEQARRDQPGRPGPDDDDLRVAGPGRIRRAQAGIATVAPCAARNTSGSNHSANSAMSPSRIVNRPM